MCNMISYVEYYKPRYFLLENVIGLLSCRLQGRQVGKNMVKGGIESGIVKFIMRSLTMLGFVSDIYKVLLLADPPPYLDTK